MSDDSGGPVVADPTPIEEPKEDHECACIAHSVYAVGTDGKTINQVDVPQHTLNFVSPQDTSTAAGATAFSTLQAPGLWNGQELTIPVTGIYYTEISFVRDVDATKDDVRLRLWRHPVGAQKERLGDAWAGESDGASDERQTGHFSMVTMLNAQDELCVEAITEGGRAGKISNTRWTTFALCCDPSIEVGYPC